MLVDKNNVGRVLPTSHVKATRRSRVLITLFVLCVVSLLFSIIFKVWPIVTITIKPEITSLGNQLDLKVDLDSRAPLISTNTIPGRIKELGEDDNQLAEQKFLVRTINGVSIVFSKDDLIIVAKQLLLKHAPPDSVILTSSISIDEGKWTASEAGRVFHGSLYLVAKYYQDPPLANWSEEIIGLDKEAAVALLSEKTGVADVQIDIYPSFLANLSKKIPNSKDDVRLTLDID